MKKFYLVMMLFLVLVAGMSAMIGCSEDNPTAPSPKPGTVVVDPSPDGPDCPWQLTGPSSYSHNGSGDATLADLKAGDYTLTWGAVAGWDLPDPADETQTLAAGGSVTFSGTYTPAGPETVSVPDAPTGPATGVQNQDLSYSPSGGTSSQGHALEYRFDWGDGGFSDWGIESVHHSWPDVDTYEVKAQARCIEHPTILSDWSAATSVEITVFVAEAVSAPDAPTGSATNTAGVSAAYTAAGAVSNYGDDLNYRFDWGDGTFSSWSASASASHSWAAEGNYEVKAQARCGDHINVESAWSPALTVVITAAPSETVSTPDAPAGPAAGETTDSLTYTASGAVNSDGHPVEYRFDFGDGTVTGWLFGLTSTDHTWTAAGSYDVTVQARCRTHTTIESAWSAATTVTITQPAEVIASPPGTINGVTAGVIDEPFEYTVFHSIATNLGHAIEGRYDWGDGTFSDWIPTAPYTASHTWTAEGTYTVAYEARCSLHTDVTYAADPLEVTITLTAVETISKPGYVNYPYSSRNPEINIPINYTAFGGTSSLAHDQEVQFDWGDGTTSAWIAELSQVSKTWTAAGTYQMVRRARCAEHTDVISEWSDPTAINAVEPEFVSTPDVPTGPATAIQNEYIEFTVTGAESNWHPDTWLEYRIDFGDGTSIDYWVTDPEIGHRYTAIGDFEVTAQARCRYPGHGEPTSEWSLPATISIVEEITTRYGPDGPYYAATGESNTFEINSASSDEGHALEYQFDFGDGTYSDWSVSETADHAFAAVGTYDVYFRARCIEHTNAVSDWSSQYRRVLVTSDPETVSQPDRPNRYLGREPIVGTEQQMSVSGSFSNHGHALEYQFDFGDGTISPWTAATPWSSYYQLSLLHTYTSIGTFDFTCTARCAIHTGVESIVSETRTFEILEDIEQPAPVTGPATGTTGMNLTFATTGATGSEGHVLEYSFEYKIGNYNIVHESDWSTSLTDDYVFTQAATYGVRVRARCATHTNAVSYHSYPPHEVVVTD